MASMELRTVRRHATAELAYAVTGTGDLSGARPGATFRPDTAVVRYAVTSQGPGYRLQVAFAGVTVRGMRLNADGQPGKRPAAEYFYPDRLELAPPWVLDLITRADADMRAGDL